MRGMNTDTGEIKDRLEIAKLLKDIPRKDMRTVERQRWTAITASQKKVLDSMTPAERVAAKVRKQPPFDEASYA
jgi:hypothetical protein